MNYNTLCLKLSSCLHSSTLTSSLSTVLFTFLSASLLHASLPPRPPSQSLLFFGRPFSTSPPARSSFISLLFWLHLFRYISLLFIPFLRRPPLLLFTPSVLAFASSPPSFLAPSHLRHTHLALPFIASGGWRATVSFNPSQCHLQTLTVTQRLHRCLTIKAVALSKAGRGVITAAARQIEPRLIWLSAHK